MLDRCVRPRDFSLGGRMSIFSKIGKGLKRVVKKVGKYALPALGIAAPFIPGVGGALAKGASAIGNVFKGDSGGMGAPNAGPQQPSVEVNGQSMAPNWVGAAGSIISGGLNYLGQRQANASNAQQAQQQMEFQADQTSTSYQRGVADMRKAGLNPMLAYSQGGADSGAGASAQMQNEMQPGVNSALSAMHTLQELQSMQAQVDLTEAQSRNVDAQTATELVRPSFVKAGTTDLKQSAEQREADIRWQLLRNRLLGETFDAQSSEISSAADLRKAQAAKEKYGLSESRAYSKFWESGYGKAYPYLSAVGEHANSAAGAVRKLIPFSIGR